MTLAETIKRVQSRRRTLTAVDRQASDPVMNLFEKTFDSDQIKIRETSDGASDRANTVELRDEDGTTLTTSHLEDLRDQLLLVNADIYVTGTRSLEDVATPDVVAALADTTFTTTRKTKFLLVHMSRHVEALALETGGGALHAGFQDLSRLHDERGTERVYRRLTEVGIETHVYGTPSSEPLPTAVRVHAVREGEIPESWFVVHDGDGDDSRKAALVSVETEPEEYEGFWTFQPDVVDDVLAHLREEYA